MTEPGQAGQPPRRAVVLTVYALLAIICLAALEGGARLAYAIRAQSPAGVDHGQLDPYKVLDPRTPGHYTLRPGYRATLEELIAAKEERRAVLAAQHYREAGDRLELPDTAVVLRINAAGFRGPELSADSSGVRILTLGNSCTFGTIEGYTYPRVMEAELRERGIPAEVVNGAVEGYDVSHILRRIEEYKALSPDVTTLYIGWNELYQTAEGAQAGLSDPEPRLYALRLAALLQQKLVGNNRETAIDQYERPKRPDPAGSDVQRLGQYEASFMDDVRHVVREMRSAGSEVVLITLPGLYLSDQAPSHRALQIGHLPAYTDNPYVLARMTERYNAELRDLADEESVHLIDLAAWGRTALQPRDSLFFDSVHLEEEGQVMVGEYLAREIATLLQ